MNQSIIRTLKFFRPLKGVILIWLMSHVFIFAIGFAVTYKYAGTSSPIDVVMAQFNRGDAYHYIDIAQNGYVNIGEQRLFIVFFPLYPLLIRLTTFSFQYINLSALLVSNLSALIASIYLFKLVKLDFPEEVAKRAVLYLSIFPTAYFLCAIYTEGLFLALVMVAMYSARKENWFVAGLCGMLATLTRSFGLILLPTLLVEYLFTREWNFKEITVQFLNRQWQIQNLITKYLIHRKGSLRKLILKNLLQRTWKTKQIDRNILWSGMVLAGFAVYLLINYQVTGDVFTFLEIQRTHWDQMLNPFQGLARSWDWATTASFPLSVTVGSAQIAFMFLGLLGVVASLLVRLRPSYTVYGVFTWMLSVSTGWWISIPRYILTMFPLFILFGLFGRRRSFNYFAIAVSSVALYAFTILFSMVEWTF